MLGEPIRCDANHDAFSQLAHRFLKRVVVSLEFLQDLILAAGPTVVQADFTISMMGVPIEARSFPLGRYFIIWDADGQRSRIPVDTDKV